MSTEPRISWIDQLNEESSQQTIDLVNYYDAPWQTRSVFFGDWHPNSESVVLIVHVSDIGTYDHMTELVSYDMATQETTIIASYKPSVTVLDIHYNSDGSQLLYYMRNHRTSEKHLVILDTTTGEEQFIPFDGWLIRVGH